jgi:hypothetical protein
MPTDITEETSGLPETLFDSTDGNVRLSDTATAAGPAKISVTKSTSESLDDLFKVANEGAKVVTEDEPSEVDPVVTETTKDEGNTDSTDDLDTKAEKARAKEVTAAKQISDNKAASDKLAAEKAKEVAVIEPDDVLKKHQAPPHASPKAAEAFANVKNAAREHIAALNQQLQEARTKSESAAAGKLPDAIEQELKELRAFRRSRDFANDPEYQKNFVAPVSAVEEAVFGKLKQNGFTDAHLESIKKIGFSKLDWEPVLEKLPTVARSLVAAKLMEHENLSEKQTEALKNAPKQEEFDKKTTEDTARKTAEDSALVEAIINKVLDGEDDQTKKPFRDLVLNKKEIPVNATDDQKKEFEAHNTFVESQNSRLKAILADRSPRMFGTLAASTLLAYRFKHEVELLRPEVIALRARLAKIRKSSSTAAAAGGAAAPGSAPKQSKLIMRGEEALDQLKNEAEGRSQ